MSFSVLAGITQLKMYSPILNLSAFEHVANTMESSDDLKNILMLIDSYSLVFPEASLFQIPNSPQLLKLPSSYAIVSEQTN